MAERLRGAFSDAVAAIAAEDMTARAEAGAALAQAFEQVEAELVVAELTARARVVGVAHARFGRYSAPRRGSTQKG